MRQTINYEKPELREYTRFGIVAEGNSQAGPGEERTDTNVCNVSGLDQE